jgi:hypothetical protein
MLALYIFHIFSLLEGQRCTELYTHDIATSKLGESTRERLLLYNNHRKNSHVTPLVPVTVRSRAL